MNFFSEYLENASIHGLKYITHSRKLMKLFWILVVLSGLTGSVVLIYESFESWAKRPISTTIEPKAIKDLRFPRLTVCPPENTFTDLNYDLLKHNHKLDNNTTIELIDYAMEVIQDHMHQNIMSRLKTFEEENRFYNWYHGITEIKLPYYQNDGKGIFHINTWAPSGKVSTVNFGDKILDYTLERHAHYKLRLNIPQTVANNTNLTLNFNVEYVKIGEFENQFVIEEELDVGGREQREENISISFTPPYESFQCKFFKKCYNFKEIQLQILLSKSIPKILDLRQMPGFSASWYFSGEEVTQTIRPFLTTPITLEFVRYVNKETTETVFLAPTGLQGGP